MPDLNELYSDQETLAQIKEAFYQNKHFPNIKLGEFFDDPYLLSDKLQLLDFKHERDPLHHNYHKAVLPSDLVARLQIQLVPLLRTFNLTSLKEAFVYRLTHKSYSMLTDEDETPNKKTMDVLLDVSDEWDEGFGGDIVYVKSDDEPLEVEPSPNTAIFVEKEAGTKSFIKYCNHYSKEYERYVVVLTFRVNE